MLHGLFGGWSPFHIQIEKASDEVEEHHVVRPDSGLQACLLRNHDLYLRLLLGLQDFNHLRVKVCVFVRQAYLLVKELILGKEVRNQATGAEHVVGEGSENAHYLREEALDGVVLEQNIAGEQLRDDAS
jgi:hypothetical protein